VCPLSRSSVRCQSEARTPPCVVLVSLRNWWWSRTDYRPTSWSGNRMASFTWSGAAMSTGSVASLFLSTHNKFLLFRSISWSDDHRTGIYPISGEDHGSYRPRGGAGQGATSSTCRLAHAVANLPHPVFMLSMSTIGLLCRAGTITLYKRWGLSANLAQCLSHTDKFDRGEPSSSRRSSTRG
jgi:hypothetical protein